jgi:hypothetical protein
MRINRKVAKTFVILLLSVCFSMLLFTTKEEPAKASISWNGGWYTNLCGSGYAATYYSCPGGCNPYSGYCGGTAVFKFRCGGQVNQCNSNESYCGGGCGFDGLNNESEQIDVFDHYCRNGGPGSWTCGPANLLGYMVWYHPPICSNTCTPGGWGPNLSLFGPADYTFYNAAGPFPVGFNYGASAGSCGGDTCNGTCRGDSSVTYQITIAGNSPNTSYYQSYYKGFANFHTEFLNKGVYQWWVTAYGSCSGQRTSGIRHFTIDRLPGLGGSIVSNQLCTFNGTTYPATAGYTGILPALASQSGLTGGINNPLKMSVTYVDPDGADDIDYMEIWVSRNGVGPANGNTGSAGRGNLHNYPWGYYLAPYASGESYFSQGSQLADCTTPYGAGQTTCYTSAPPSNYIAYAYPNTINKSGNQITVQWDVGLMSAAKFDGNLVVYAQMIDKQNIGTGWAYLGAWKADVTRPVSTANLTIKSPLTFDVNYTTFDAAPLAGASLKKCTATSIGIAPPIVITRTAPAPAGGTASFGFVGATSQPCIDNQTGLISYQSNATPFNSSIDFSFSQADYGCNVGTSAPASLLLINPWLMTTDGDTYSKLGYSPNPLIQIAAINDPSIDEGLVGGTGVVSSPRFFTTMNGKTPYLSTYGYLDNVGIGVPRSSTNGLNILPYPDQNGVPKPSSNFTNWYDFLESRINTNVPAARIKVLAPGIYGPIATSTLTATAVNGPAGPTVDQRVVVEKVSGDLTLKSITCDTKTIFLITGNLQIEPELLISEPTAGAAAIVNVPSNMNGCLFIVKNKTTVGIGTNKVPPASNQAIYDQVRSFIITDKFESSVDATNNGLQIRGGVITNQNNTFKRDIGIVLNQTAPSEIFRYDGGRYIYIFGKILTDTIDFSIKEVPFIETSK